MTDLCEVEEEFLQKNDDNSTFVMLFPPPNITGNLHIGHALTIAIQDSIARFHSQSRHKYKKILWIPGSDHAGIATQSVIERKFLRDNPHLSKDERFQLINDWKLEKQKTIKKQMLRMKPLMNWDKQYFTLDEDLSLTVKTAFVKLYDRGLIKRSYRMCNWSTVLKSTISKIEVDTIHLERKTNLEVPGYSRKIPFGFLLHFRYKLADSDEYITVSTTRPETIFGDVAIAVNSEDRRYTNFIGKNCIHPFSNRLLPIIADDILVDPKFGTGAVKITPAHDENDYECAKRHQLPIIPVIKEDGTLNNNVNEKYSGLPRFTARTLIIRDLKEQNLFVKMENYETDVRICSRSKDILESILKPQWYFDCSDLAKEAINFVSSGDMKIIPKSFEKDWYSWLNRTNDWCISRQLWWGHKIPAYYAKLRTDTDEMLFNENSERWFIGRNYQECFGKAKDKFGANLEGLLQDPDVLDTWFSSGLLPMSVFMKDPSDFTTIDATCFPNSLLETGNDILFFWVARMAMMSAAFTGLAPFKTVLLHGLVRDPLGKKMSKATGNVIDPLHIINGATLEELKQSLICGNLDPKQLGIAHKIQSRLYPTGIPKCGSDVMRFYLCHNNQSFNDMKLNIRHLKKSKSLATKLINATKFTNDLVNRFGWDKMIKSSSNFEPDFIDQWIMKLTNDLINQCFDYYDSYVIGKVCDIYFKFIFDDLCNRYLEYVKYKASNSMTGRANLGRSLLILVQIMKKCLRIIYPIMPLLSTKLFNKLSQTRETVDQHFPILFDSPKHKDFSSIVEASIHIENIREIRSFFQMNRKMDPRILISVDRPHPLEKMKNDLLPYIKSLCWSSRIDLSTKADDLASFRQIEHVTLENIWFDITDVKSETIIKLKQLNPKKILNDKRRIIFSQLQ
jgi:valyl-tRNA synthetase